MLHCAHTAVTVKAVAFPNGVSQQCLSCVSAAKIAASAVDAGSGCW